MPFFGHDGIDFHYQTRGEGTPVVFQHGLGGDVSQPLALFHPPPGFRQICFDCRGHGETWPLGDPEKIGFSTFAGDLAALLDHLEVNKAIVGGISMGAALSLRFGLQYPERLLALVLSRPAWLAGPMEDNARVFGHIAELLREKGPVLGKEIFAQSEDCQRFRLKSEDSAQSLLSQFDHPRAVETAVKLERIPRDAPLHDMAELKSIKVPTLVLANRQDPIHPFEYGEILAAAIPGAILREITPKSVSLDRHAEDVQRCLEDFLKCNSNRSGPA
jgi:pimeloyl-ACP methyl ester carboxylesterase